MKRIFKRIAILLVITLLAPTFLDFIPSLSSLTAEEVSAAALKAELGKTETMVGISSSPEYVYFKTQNYDAVYTYTSADPKIATVSLYGAISGVAKGNTTITVTETYNDVVTEVGKIAVSVVGPKIEAKSIDVGVNSTTYAYINYMNYDAVYTYKSSDTKIAKIDQYGGITGVKLGKVTISVTEKYKNKTVKVGSFTANVVSGKLTEKAMEVPVTSYAYSEISIDCRNSKAVYKYKSADSKIATVDKDGLVTGVKKGTTTISVTETYNKKTVKLGSITVKVVGASINPEYKSIDIGINSSNYFSNIIGLNYANDSAVYTCESADSSIVWTGYEDDGWGGSNFMVKGTGLGTATLTVYEEYKGVKTRIGTIKATVKEIPVTSLTFDTYWLEDIAGVLTATYYLDDYWWSNLSYYIYKEPYNSTTPITYASSDETVITIDADGNPTPLAEGNATITITCGEFSEEFYAVVKASMYSDTTGDGGSGDFEGNSDGSDGSGDEGDIFN